MIKNLLAETNSIMSYVLIGVLVLAMVAMFIFNSKQRKKQQQEAEKRINGLQVGDKIKTIGMICGEIVELCNDGTLVIKTGSEESYSFLKIDKQAIYQIDSIDNSSSDVFVNVDEEAGVEEQLEGENTEEAAENTAENAAEGEAADAIIEDSKAEDEGIIKE